MTVEIPLNMNQLDAALVRGSDNSAAGHRGLWFYSPDDLGERIEVGDTVVFTRFGEPAAYGRVTALCNPAEMPKVCSRINSHGFRWHDLNADEIEEILAENLAPVGA